MSSDIERRVGSLLNSSGSQGAVPVNDSSMTPIQGGKEPSAGSNIRKPGSLLDTDSAKEKLSLELKQRQENMKVHKPICSSYNIIICLCRVLKYSNCSSYLLQFVRVCQSPIIVYYMQSSDSLRAIQSFREKLPAFKVRSEFLKAVAENQV